MSDLNSIPGLRESSAELLEAAGFLDLESLAKASPDELTRELSRANGILKIAKEDPSRTLIATWIATARDLTGEPELPAEQPEMPVDHEQTAEVAAMLDKAPFAIPLPARQLVENKLSVADIPPAILLNRYSGALDVRTSDRPPGHKPQKHVAAGYVQVAEPVPQRLDIDTSRMKTTDDYIGPARRRAPGKSSPKPSKDAERVALIRAPREQTNRGLDPSSRRYVRGVLHSHPNSLTFGAIITLLMMLLLPIAIASGILLLLSDLVPDRFGWVPPWVLGFPLALPVLGFAYLIWGLSGSCRICGQRLFMPRACRKNVKAHHVTGLGYIIPVCFHMLFFRWFRCTYCGTPVRLKK